MKTTFRKKFALLVTVVAATLAGCGGKGTTASSATPTSSTVNIDTQRVTQYASPEVKAAVTTAASSGSDCLSAEMGALSIGAWWVSGSFNIVNSCATAQALSGTQIQLATAGATLNAASFQINTTKPWLSSSFASFTGSGSAVLMTVNSVTNPANNLPYSLAANGGSINVSFGYNPNGTQLSGITATINGATPVVPATLSVDVNSTGLAGYCTTSTSCNIAVILTGQSGQYSQTLATLTSSTGNTTYNLTGLLPGTYTLSTGTLPAGVNATFSATTVTLSSGETGPTLTLTLNKAPVTTGSLDFTLTNPDSNLFSEPSLAVHLQAAGGLTTSIQAVFGQPVSATLAGGSYTLSAGLGLASASQGIYKALEPISSSVSAGTTTTISPVWTSPSVLISQPISVTGLNDGDSATLVFTDNSYTFNQEVVTATAAGQTINTTYKFPAGDIVTVTVMTNTNYAAVAPFTMTMPSTGTAGAVAITVMAKTQPVHQIVGYFETWEATATWAGSTYSIANIPSYVGIIPLAFAKPDSTYVAGSFDFAAAGLGISAVPSVAVEAIQLAQAKGQKMLLSVGGATYPNFAAFNLTATLALVQDLGLDGVDLDYEASTAGCSNLNTASITCPTDANMISIITQLRTGLNALSVTMGKRMYLSAAVWSIGAYGSTSFPTTSNGPVGAMSGLWVNPLKQVGSDFDMLFLMAYDAGNATTTGYDPIAALKAYQALFSGPIYLGIEVPPEAWGGNLSTPAQDVAEETTASQLGAAGTMIWALQSQGNDGAGAVNAQSYLSLLCVLYSMSNCTQTIPLN